MASIYENKSKDAESTAGPADYNNEDTIGRRRILQAKLKAAPKYSFSRTLTFRTNDCTNKIQNAHTVGRDVRVDPGAMALDQCRPTGNDGLMLYYRTGATQNPGVGDYDIEK